MAKEAERGESRKADSGGDAGQAEVQERMDEATEQGFMGLKVDPTPNERYSLESDDWRTPESDPEAAQAVGSSKFTAAAAEAEKQ